MTVILLAGLGLRAATLLWGTPLLPYSHSFHPDESKSYRMAADFPEVYATDRRARIYGTAFSYTLGMALFPLKVLVAYGLQRPDEYDVMVLMASRLASLFLGTAAIYLVYLMALRLFSPGTALLAAAFTACSFYHAMNSSFGTLDVPMSFLMLANLLFCFSVKEGMSLSKTCWGGVLTAFLVGTKLTGIVFLAVPLFLVLNSRFPARRFAVYLLAMTGVLFLFQPHLLFHPQNYLEIYRAEEMSWNGRLFVSPAQSLSVWAHSTAVALGWPVATLAFAGLLMVKTKVPRVHWLFLVGLILPSYLLWLGFLPPRFLIPIAPILCLFAAAFCVSLMQSPFLPVQILGITLSLLGLGYSLYLCGSGVWIRWNDPRYEAARYLAQTVPTGTTFGLSSDPGPYPVEYWRFPAVDFSRCRFVPLWQYPDTVVTDGSDLNRMSKALRSPSLQSDLSWDPARNKDWNYYSPPSPRLFAFYQKLLDPVKSPYQLVQRFSIPVNVPLEFAPTEIRVYRKRGLIKESTILSPGK